MMIWIEKGNDNLRVYVWKRKEVLNGEEK